VKGSGKGQTASESFAINHQRQNLQAKVDQFQREGILLMKISPSMLSGEGIHKPRHSDDLNQLDFAEVDGEGDWLAADVEETVEEEEPEVTPERMVLCLPSNFTLQQRKEYGLLELGNILLEPCLGVFGGPRLVHYGEAATEVGSSIVAVMVEVDGVKFFHHLCSHVKVRLKPLHGDLESVFNDGFNGLFRWL